MSRSNNTAKGGGLGGSKATVPAMLFDSVEYVVTVGIGSTHSKLTLAYDTGSDLTWTQCKPCSSCYPQSDPIFDPSHSSSYANMPCTSSFCSDSGSGISTTCCGSTCNYQITYGDQSSSSGKLATGTLMLTSTDVIRNFQFGCSGFKFGLFGGVAGLLGLARDGLSIIGQTASKYGRYFSYCLPSSSSSTGYLTFGKTNETTKSLTLDTDCNNSRKFILLWHQPSGNGSRRNCTGNPIDSLLDGGGNHRLWDREHSTSADGIQCHEGGFSEREASHKMAKSFELFDTCYDLRNTKSVVVPKIRFTFSGGAFVDLDHSGILYTISDSQACLAFVPNNDDTDIIIYGNVQQKTFEVIYDVARGQLGFAPNGCM